MSFLKSLANFVSGLFKRKEKLVVELDARTGIVNTIARREAFKEEKQGRSTFITIDEFDEMLEGTNTKISIEKREGKWAVSFPGVTGNLKAGTAMILEKDMRVVLGRRGKPLGVLLPAGSATNYLLHMDHSSTVVTIFSHYKSQSTGSSALYSSSKGRGVTKLFGDEVVERVNALADTAPDSRSWSNDYNVEGRSGDSRPVKVIDNTKPERSHVLPVVQEADLESLGLRRLDVSELTAYGFVFYSKSNTLGRNCSFSLREDIQLIKNTEGKITGLAYKPVEGRNEFITTFDFTTPSSSKPESTCTRTVYYRTHAGNCEFLSGLSVEKSSGHAVCEHYKALTAAHKGPSNAHP